MAIFSKLIDKVLFKGGILAAGVICLYLTKSDYFPRYIYPVSYGMTSIGILGLIVGFGNLVHDDEDDDPGFEERMAEFYRLKPMLEEKLREEGQLMLEYELAKRRWKEIDEMERASLRFEKRISAYEARKTHGGTGILQKKRHLSAHHGQLPNPESSSRTRRSSSLERSGGGNLSKFPAFI